MVYLHNLRTNIYDGQKIRPGDIMSFGDSTGFSTGDHVHFHLKEIDDNGHTKNRDNGYGGAIDPTPFWENTYISDVHIDEARKRNYALQKQVILLMQAIIKKLMEQIAKKS